MIKTIKNEQVKDKVLMINSSGVRLMVGLALAILIVTLLIVSFDPGSKGKEEIALTQVLLSERGDLSINSKDMATRVVEQKFQIHMQENDQQLGEIPSVEVWVLNDPFYPLIGAVADLRSKDGILPSKEWQMLGYPNYEQKPASSTTPGSTSSSSVSATSVTAGTTQRVVQAEEIYEVRGIQYGKIKVNDTVYDKLKAGSSFAEVFKVVEIKDNQTIIILCGDEQYELKVGQLRKI